MKEHKCDICGRELTRKIKSHGYVLCDKHYKQYKKYGKFLDNNPREMELTFDKNKIYIYNIYMYISMFILFLIVVIIIIIILKMRERNKINNKFGEWEES